jgi:hypothetical protein
MQALPSIESILILRKRLCLSLLAAPYFKHNIDIPMLTFDIKRPKHFDGLFPGVGSTGVD